MKVADGEAEDEEAKTSWAKKNDPSDAKLDGHRVLRPSVEVGEHGTYR